MNEEYQAEVVNGAPRRQAAPGTSTTEGFGSVTSTALAETASSSVAAQARAAVESRYIIAMQRPRDWDDVRLALMKECKRPRFAQTARYLKPVGKGVTGFSIRFAEAALRCMRNVLPETSTVYDDSLKRIMRVTVTDLEANVSYSQDVVIEKTVERSKPREGEPPIAVRTNSRGFKTYTVRADDDDLLNKSAALVSKALRGLALRLVPGDILDEAMDEILRTQQNEDAKDPGAARKALVDAFAAIGVKPSDLKDYLGHDLDSSTPAELADLRAVYAALRDGEATWKATIEHKKGALGKAEETPTTAKDKVAAKAKEAKAKDAPKVETPAPPKEDAQDDGEPPADYVSPGDEWAEGRQ